jgi:L-glutamine-phosphate cytidylyltransferase
MTSRGLILAAGRGSRLGCLTEDKPKPLIEVGGLSLAGRSVHALRTAGILDISLVVGYRAERLACLGLPCIDNPEWAQTGIYWSLAQAASLLQAGATIVSYGDIFFEGRDAAALAATPGDIVVAFDPAALSLWSQRFTDPLADLENFQVDRWTGRCTCIGGRLQPGATLNGQFTGLFKLSESGWQTLQATAGQLPSERQRSIDMTSLLSLAIANGVTVDTMPLKGIWGEVDEPSDIAVYERLYFTSRSE